jgi:hypothetical protein
MYQCVIHMRLVCECEDVASADTMQLLNPSELQDAAGSLQKFN